MNTIELNRCLVVIKQTALAQGGRAAQLAQQGDATARRLIRADAEHQRTLEAVRQALTRRRISFAEAFLSKLNARFKRQLATADLVITIGGDGTVLGASHYVRRGLLLGVNSAPGDSVGHFCSVTRADFAARLDAILSSSWKPVTLARLAVLLDGQPLPELALNDVLIAHASPAATTRYLIQLGQREEEQRSSGIWIATAAGSTAGIHSAGGRVMPLRSARLQYLVRELYRETHGGRVRDYQLVRGFVEPHESLSIASKMPDGWLYLDGARTAYRFPFGTRARLQAAETRLKIFLNRLLQP
jgi:NAD+ kinase